MVGSSRMAKKKRRHVIATSTPPTNNSEKNSTILLFFDEYVSDYILVSPDVAPLTLAAALVTELLGA